MGRESVTEDVTTSCGFLRAILNCLRVRPGGLNFFGMPCGSFSFMSSSQHCRTEEAPFGCGAYGFVHHGNMIAARASLLIYLTIARSCMWFLENPGLSRCCLLPYLRNLLDLAPFLNTKIIHWWGADLFYVDIFCHNCSY